MFWAVQVWPQVRHFTQHLRLQLPGDTVGLVCPWATERPARGSKSSRKSVGAEESAAHGISGEALRAGFIYPGGDKIRGHLITVYHNGKGRMDDGFCHSVLHKDKAVIMHYSKGNSFFLCMEKVLRIRFMQHRNHIPWGGWGSPSLRFIRRELERPSTTSLTIEAVPALNRRLNWKLS